LSVERWKVVPFEPSRLYRRPSKSLEGSAIQWQVRDKLWLHVGASCGGPGLKGRRLSPDDNALLENGRQEREIQASLLTRIKLNVQSVNSTSWCLHRDCIQAGLQESDLVKPMVIGI
jgi:hypothetical protein